MELLQIILLLSIPSFVLADCPGCDAFIAFGIVAIILAFLSFCCLSISFYNSSKGRPGMVVCMNLFALGAIATFVIALCGIAITYPWTNSNLGGPTNIVLGILAIFLVCAQCIIATRYHFLKRYGFLTRTSDENDPTDETDSKQLGKSMARSE